MEYTPDNTIIPRWEFTSGPLSGASDQSNVVAPGSLASEIEFTNDSTVPGGQTFESLELTITDGLGHISKLSINVLGGTATIEDGDDDIDFSQDLKIVAVCKTAEGYISQVARTTYIHQTAHQGNDSTDNPYLDGTITNNAKQVTDSPGYDVGAFLDVFIVRYDDGSIGYERPIGTPYTPVGGVYPKASVVVGTLSDTQSDMTFPGSIPPALKWRILNVGAVNGIVNGATLPPGEEQTGKAEFNPVSGTFLLTAPASYDPSGSTFNVSYSNYV